MCQMAGMWPTQLAKKAGISPSTINRFLNDSSVKYKISASTLEKIEKAVSEIISQRMGSHPYSSGPKAPQLALFDLDGDYQNANDGNYQVGTPFISDDIVLSTASIIGQANEEIWTERLSDTSIYVTDASLREVGERIAGLTALNLYVRFPILKQFSEKECFALVVSDESMNQVYPPGSIVVAIPIEQAPNLIKPGSNVIAVREDLENRSGNVQNFIREFRVDNSGRLWLWPRSSEPKHQIPIELQDSNAGISILALIVASLRVELSPDCAQQA